MIAARTSHRLFLIGAACPGLGLPKGGRYTSPERLALLEEVLYEQQGAAPPAGNASSAGAASVAPPAPARLVPAATLPPATVSVRCVAAGADFAALLTWDGRVVDTRCLAGTNGGGARGALEWSGLWRPPACHATAVAVGGCWQGEALGRGLLCTVQP